MDWEKIRHLLDIAEKANNWPMLHGLRNVALAELVKYTEAVTEKPSPQPAPSSPFLAQVTSASELAIPESGTPAADIKRRLLSEDTAQALDE